MKNGKKRVLHLIAVMAFALFIVTGMASTCQSAPKPAAQVLPNISNDYISIKSRGKIGQVNIAPVKDFTIAGIIFVESNAVFDSDDHIVEGSKITYDMLMREAQKLGADDIINIKIDEIEKISVTEEIRMVPTKVSTDSGNTKTVDKETTVQIINKSVTYKANALAIKYTTIVTSLSIPSDLYSNKQETARNAADSGDSKSSIIPAIPLKK